MKEIETFENYNLRHLNGYYIISEVKQTEDNSKTYEQSHKTFATVKQTIDKLRELGCEESVAADMCASVREHYERKVSDSFIKDKANKKRRGAKSK